MPAHNNARIRREWVQLALLFVTGQWLERAVNERCLVDFDVFIKPALSVAPAIVQTRCALQIQSCPLPLNFPFDDKFPRAVDPMGLDNDDS